MKIRQIVTFCLTIILFSSAPQLFAQNKPLHLFLIGNSFSQNASKYLPEISKSGGHELTIGRAELPGCPLSRHWESVVANDADPTDPKGKPYGGKSLRELLSAGKWDVVTLQQYSLLSGDSATYQPYARQLYQLIKKLQPDAEVVFHQTWAYRIDSKSFGKINGEIHAKDQQEMWEKSRAAYHHIAKALGTRIIPSGDALQKVNTDSKWGFKKDTAFNYNEPHYPDLPDQKFSLNVGYFYSKNQKLSFDSNHANDAGCYLAGLVWYRFLFNEDPTKIAFKPVSVDQEFANVLKEAAKSVVKGNALKTDRFMDEVVNYDEAAVPAYTLPKLLQTSKGQKINRAADWESKRRPEVLSLFEENVYGQIPAAIDSIKFKITNETPNAMGGKAHLKEIQITAWKKGNSISIPVVLFTPNHSKKPAPVFLLINNRSKKNTDPYRITKSTFWPAEMVIDSGYAIAAFHVGDVAPDNKNNYQNGVLKQLFPEYLEEDNGMKAIGAWAASRVMDYFKTDKNVDFNKVSIVGHSRGGKTALWAGAQDQRFAMVFSSCSGSTGASLARRQYGETVSLITKQFGYWFNNNYKKYSHKVDSLPVDQHMLIALIAPRPVYTTNATQDRWADPYGSYLSLINAVPVYQLYHKKISLSPEMPQINQPIIESAIGYHFREGIHDLNVYDWTNFIRFANYNYHKN